MTGPGAQPADRGACLSDLRLDEIIAGDRSREDHAGHLAACERCAERLDLLAVEAQTDAAQVEMLLARATEVAQRPATVHRPRRGTWRALVLAGGLATVAVVLGVAVLPGDGERVKGTAIGFWVQRDGEIQRGVSGARFGEGDALRFTVSSGEPGYFLLVGVESSGEVSPYHPFGGARSVAVAAGDDQPLPASLVLDAAPEAELFVGIFSPDPVTVAEVRRAVADARAELGRGDELDAASISRLELPGAIHVVVINKGD